MTESAMLPLVRELSAALDCYLARASMGRSARQVLQVAVNCPGIPAGEIGRRVGLTSGAISGIVDRLEREGLVRRQGGHDRRATLVVATGEGVRVIEGIWDPLSDALEAHLVAFRSDELACARMVLRVVAEAVRKAGSA